LKTAGQCSLNADEPEESNEDRLKARRLTQALNRFLLCQTLMKMMMKTS